MQAKPLDWEWVLSMLFELMVAIYDTGMLFPPKEQPKPSGESSMRPASGARWRSRHLGREGSIGPGFAFPGNPTPWPISLVIDLAAMCRLGLVATAMLTLALCTLSTSRSTAARRCP